MLPTVRACRAERDRERERGCRVPLLWQRGGQQARDAAGFGGGRGDTLVWHVWKCTLLSLDCFGRGCWQSIVVPPTREGGRSRVSVGLLPRVAAALESSATHTYGLNTYPNIRWPCLAPSLPSSPSSPPAFCNEIYLFSRLSIWRFVSCGSGSGSDYHDDDWFAIAKEALKLCRWAMLLHSDESDKRLLNCPAVSSTQTDSTYPTLPYPTLPSSSAAGKLFVFVFVFVVAFAFKLVWANAKNVNILCFI